MNRVLQEPIHETLDKIRVIISQALKLKKAGYFQESEQTLAQALVGILPKQADLIELEDEAGIIPLLPDFRLIEAYVEILLERAALSHAMDQQAQILVFQKRAIRLFSLSLNEYLSISTSGLILWGRITGLELQLILSIGEYEQRKMLDGLIQKGTIRVLQ